MLGNTPSSCSVDTPSVWRVYQNWSCTWAGSCGCTMISLLWGTGRKIHQISSDLCVSRWQGGSPKSKYNNPVSPTSLWRISCNLLSRVALMIPLETLNGCLVLCHRTAISLSCFEFERRGLTRQGVFNSNAQLLLFVNENKLVHQ